MANTLTNLIPDFYKAMDQVSREMVGFIPASTLDVDASRAAVGQSVITNIAPAGTAEDITAATNPPDTGDQTIGNLSMSITKSRAVPFRWTGEEETSMGGAGIGAARIRVDQIAQAIRTLVNEVEADLAVAAKIAASRAYGTAGATPFASTLGDSAQVLKILKDNGAPNSDLNMVIDTTAGANMRTLTALNSVNQAGDSGLLRQGILADVHGFSFRESGQISTHTKGTGSGYLINDASAAIGDTTITADTGTGTVLAGDVVTIAGDTNKYIVATALSGGSFTIGEPGLKVAVADDAAITVGADYTPNVAFHRNSLVLLARTPELPAGGDAAADRTIVTDTVSGLSFEFAMYPQYRRMRYEVGMAWGVKGIKSNHSAILLG